MSESTLWARKKFLLVFFETLGFGPLSVLDKISKKKFEPEGSFRKIFEKTYWISVVTWVSKDSVQTTDDWKILKTDFSGKMSSRYKTHL